MSQPKGSAGVALAVAAVIIIAVTSVGYYQFVVCKPNTCSTSTTSSATASSAPACKPPSCLTIQINYGAAVLTTTAYSPDVAKLVIGVNNSFQFHNNDSESGGVFHSGTSRNQTGGKADFDTGIIGFNVTSQVFTITTPGTYPYYCEVHPTTMVGTILVVASSSSSAVSSSSSTSTQSSKAAPSGAQIAIVKGASTNQASPGITPDTATVVIGVNNTVTWTNNDTVGHTLIFTSQPAGATVANSEIIGPGLTFTTTFTVPGTYHYQDGIDGWVKGTLIVKAG